MEAKKYLRDCPVCHRSSGDNVSRRICRETLGEAPAQINTAVIKQLQDRLELLMSLREGYHYLIR